jgi:hypothetical protein
MAKQADAGGRDLVITNGGGFPIQRKVRSDGWTRARRQTFLDTLAATCNVTESCRAAGMALRAVYPLKARDAEFAAAWDRAIAEGFDRLRTQALEHCGAGLPIDCDGSAAAPPPFDFEKALRLLYFYRAQDEGVASGRTGRKRRNATREETNAALIKALAAARKRIARRLADEEPGA